MFKELKIFSFSVLPVILVGCLVAQDISARSDAELGLQLEGEGSTRVEPFLISVENIVARVREANPRLLFERESVQRALEQSFQQRAELLPQVSLRAEQRRTQFARGFAGDAFDSPAFNSFEGQLVGSLSVFDSKKYADFRVAKLSAAIAEDDFEVAYQDILEQVIMTYFTHLRDLRRYDIVEGNIGRETELLNLATDRFKAGAAIKIDVTRAEVRLATERRSLMEAETDMMDSLLQLKALLDLDFDADALIDRRIIDRGLKAPPSIKLYAGQKPLTEVRHELVSQQKQLDQARLVRKAADWQRLPTLELFGQWGYETDVAFDGGEEEGWLVGFRATVPIFEGFRIGAERREADAAVRQNTHLMTELRNEIEREFRFAMIEMDSRYAQIEISRDEIRLGRDEMAQAQERYREGLADNRELIDAQERLSDAEDSELRAIYLYGLSRLAFARSVGAVERVLD